MNKYSIGPLIVTFIAGVAATYVMSFPPKKPNENPKKNPYESFALINTYSIETCATANEIIEDFKSKPTKKLEGIVAQTEQIPITYYNMYDGNLRLHIAQYIFLDSGKEQHALLNPILQPVRIGQTIAAYITPLHANCIYDSDLINVLFGFSSRNSFNRIPLNAEGIIKHFGIVRKQEK